MKKIVVLSILLMVSNAIFADPPCVPQPQFYTGSDRFDWQVRAGRPPANGWGWPQRQVHVCEDIWVMWAPTMYRNGGWLPGHWMWVGDTQGSSSYFYYTEAYDITEIATTNPYTGKVTLVHPSPWYAPHVNQILTTLANWFNQHNVYWGWQY